MKTNNHHIISDPSILFGKPVIKGTRIPVYLIIEKLASGYSINDLLESYPNLSEKQIQACLKFASDSVKNDVLIPLTK